MPDLDEIKAFNAKAGTKCHTCRVLDGLHGVRDELRQTVVAALVDPEIQNVALSRWLGEVHKVYLSHRSIQRHRSGECRG